MWKMKVYTHLKQQANLLQCICKADRSKCCRLVAGNIVGALSTDVRHTYLISQCSIYNCMPHIFDITMFHLQMHATHIWYHNVPSTYAHYTYLISQCSIYKCTPHIFDITMFYLHIFSGKQFQTNVQSTQPASRLTEMWIENNNPVT